MGGASTTRNPANTAALPGLTGGIEGMLKQFQADPNAFLQSIMGGGMGGGQSSLSQQMSNTYLNQMGGQRPGGAVIDAAKPIFQKNLQLGADTLRQAGPRFNSNTERLVGDQNQKSINDFNLFAQSAVESGLNRQLTAAGQAGGFMNGQNANMAQLFSGIFNQLMGAGVGSPIFDQNPGLFQNIMQTIGTVGGLGVGLMGAGGGGAPKANTWQAGTPAPGGILGGIGATGGQMPWSPRGPYRP